MSGIVEQAREVAENEHEDPWYRPYAEVVVRVSAFADELDAMIDDQHIDHRCRIGLAKAAHGIREAIHGGELKLPGD